MLRVIAQETLQSRSRLFVLVQSPERFGQQERDLRCLFTGKVRGALGMNPCAGRLIAFELCKRERPVALPIHIVYSEPAFQHRGRFIKLFFPVEQAAQSKQSAGMTGLKRDRFFEEGTGLRRIVLALKDDAQQIVDVWISGRELYNFLEFRLREGQVSFFQCINARLQLFARLGGKYGIPRRSRLGRRAFRPHVYPDVRFACADIDILLGWTVARRGHFNAVLARRYGSKNHLHVVARVGFLPKRTHARG